MKKYRLVILVLAVIVIIEAVLLVWLWVEKPRKKIPKAAAPLARGLIAIVIDDWGYNLNNLAVLKQLRSRLTVSVLPNLPYSKRVAQEAHALGFEVILHLPMEPEEKRRLEQNTIVASLDEGSIKNILSGDLNNIGYARGINNHMGSKATKDLRVMGVVFDELKRRGLYFLDSYVTSDSVGGDLSRKKSLGFAKRDVFLDNEEDPEYIKGQINKLKMKAKIYGQAIGIGHDRMATLEVLKDVLPLLEKEGYKLVFVSELVRR